MHRSYLPYLVCPETQQPLQLDVTEADGDFVIEGSLTAGERSYPIVRGIPRFAGYQAGGTYANSFGYQWCKWSRVQFESQNVGTPMEGYTRSMWERITGVSEERVRGKVILDSGCGPGRFIDTVISKGGRAIGLDLSDAVEAAQDNFAGNPNVLICQADVLNPPIRQQSIDGAFSIGVFHHTPDPARGFAEMTRCVRPGGWSAVCVYPKGGYYDFPTVTMYRTIFKWLQPILGHYPPLAYSYFTSHVVRPFTDIPVLGRMLRVAMPQCRLPDRMWSLLDTFDSVTPTYQSAHQSHEVFGWLREAGLERIEPSDWGFTAYRGSRPLDAHSEALRKAS